MQLQKSLACCHQNNKSVAEYTHELHELFNIIGDVPERDRVLKLWNGVRPVIQKGLWHDSLNPKSSSWDKVVMQAEIIEISENVAEHWDCRSNTSGGSMNNQGGGQAKGKNHLSNMSAQSNANDQVQIHPRSGSRFNSRWSFCGQTSTGRSQLSQG